MTRRLFALAAAVMAASVGIAAQGGRPASPAGTAATQVGGKYVPGNDGQVLSRRQVDRNHLRSSHQTRSRVVRRHGRELRQDRQS